jgi:ferredoxin
MDVAQELSIPCVELADSVPLPPSADASFHKIEIARRVLESDLIVNLPKMKTHAQMLLTLGVKNLFGCVVAQRKAEWHYKVGLRREMFASLLLDIWDGIQRARDTKGPRPKILTILDGVVGMDGYGPTNGNPYPYGVIAGSLDALTMDFWLCRMMGVRLEDYPLWQAAALRRMPQCELNEDDLEGDFAPTHAWQGLNIPRLDSLRVVPVLSRLPFAKALEQALTSRPIHRPDRCVGCGKCASVCPAQAIALKGKRLSFDYKKCIRCYCCHEMCPADAIAFKDGLVMKVMRFLEK